MNNTQKKSNSKNSRNNKKEIFATCRACESKRVLAYWDEELEQYIYLAEEPVLCLDCKMSNIVVLPTSIQRKPPLKRKQSRLSSFGVSS